MMMEAEPASSTLQALDSGQSNIHTMNWRLALTKNHLLF